MTREPQLASAVLMIRPVRFESNPQTLESNKFQGRPKLTAEQQQALAVEEFDHLAQSLSASGIEVICFDDTAEPHTPDAIFPNNWVSFHADGTVVLYPMMAPNRRHERRADIIDSLSAEHGFHISRVVDLTAHEAEENGGGHYLEGTGSLVLDRVNHIAYACLSPRTDLGVLADFAQQLDYEVVAFDAVDGGGTAIYHTNVLMSIGEHMAVICEAAIPREAQRHAVLEKLRQGGHQVLSLSVGQMNAFAGNMLELRSRDGGRVMAMSNQAYCSLEPQQLAQIERYATILSTPIDDIEAAAGGSVRCMLAELHLPRAGQQ